MLQGCQVETGSGVALASSCSKLLLEPKLNDSCHCNAESQAPLNNRFFLIMRVHEACKKVLDVRSM